MRIFGWNLIGFPVRFLFHMRRAIIIALGLCAVPFLSWADTPEAPLLPDLAQPERSAEEVPLVPFERLITLLPEPPLLWKAEKPTGNTMENETVRLTTVRRVYYRGEEEESPRVVVTMIDSANNHEYFQSGDNVWPSNSESEEGFDRRVVIEGMRAFEHYSKAARTSSLSLFVGERYFVQIELTYGDPAELKDWLKLIDIKRLASLK